MLVSGVLLSESCIRVDAPLGICMWKSSVLVSHSQALYSLSLKTKCAAVTVDMLIDMVMANYDNIVTGVNNNNLTSYSWCDTAGMIDL